MALGTKRRIWRIKGKTLDFGQNLKRKKRCHDYI